MDEILFRGSQKIDHLQYQIGVAATEGKKAILLYSGQTKDVIISSLNSPRSVQLQDAVKEIWLYVISVADECKYKLLYYTNPNRLLRKLAIFKGKWSSRDISFACAGLLIGSLIGFYIGLSSNKNKIYRYMQAVQCTNYHGIEGAVFVEDAIAPTVCGPNEVMVNVKAGSVHLIDIKICNGYGRIIRNLMSKYYQYSKHDIPFTIGRDCSGIVTDIGANVTRLDIGDEVWLTQPFWAPGTLSQLILVSESRVAKKPKKLGFEGACCLPYAGSLALEVLKDINISKENALQKRIFIQGGCTPVGCALLQILTAWGAHITTTCFPGAKSFATVLGAHDIIILSDTQITMKSSQNIQIPELSKHALYKELELRPKFDGIVNTRDCGLTINEFVPFLNPKSVVISTVSDELPSDSYVGFLNLIYKGYVRIKAAYQKIFGHPLNDFGEPHICHHTLDTLTQLVDDGLLKTLVDKVYHPADIVTALYHIQSTKSIGSTVISFSLALIDYAAKILQMGMPKIEIRISIK